MFDEIRKMFKGEGATWHLVGYDINANTSYPIAGPFFSQIATERAAQQAFRRLEEKQSTSETSDGSSDTMPNQLYIIKPDGTIYRYPPEIVEQH